MERAEEISSGKDDLAKGGAGSAGQGGDVRLKGENFSCGGTGFPDGGDGSGEIAQTKLTLTLFRGGEIKVVAEASGVMGQALGADVAEVQMGGQVVYDRVRSVDSINAE